MEIKKKIKWLTITFLINIFLLINLNCCDGVQEFEVEPSDITVQRGSSVTFPCKVRNLKGILQWTMDGFGLGTDRELVSYQRYTMIGSNETGNYSLHISAALLADEAEFQCQVSATEEEELLRSKTVKLTVLYPPKDDLDQVYIDPESPLHAISGSKVRITCRGGLTKPVSVIKWYKGEKEITKGVKKSVEALSNSMLESITSWIDFTVDNSYHDQNISCHVSHKALDDPIVRTLLLIVQFPPSVTIAKHFHKSREGDDLKFTCTADGNPPNFRFHWEVNNVTVVGKVETELVLKKVTRRENTADVTCIVSNAIGNGRANELLNIEYEPMFKEDPADVDGEDGEEIKLKCLVDSNPPAEIVWTHHHSQMVLGRGSEWKVTVSKESEGMYRCRATTPGYPEISRTIRVFLRGPPEISPNQISYGVEGDVSQVACVIHSIPRPDEVIWLKNGASINPKNSPKYDESEVKTRDGLRHLLIIYQSDSSDFTSYNCTAKNSYGIDTEIIELRKQQALPLVTTVVAIIGGAIFIVIVAILIILFKKQGSGYKDPNNSTIEKHSVRSSDQSLTHDSVTKGDSRTTATGSEMSPSDEEADYSNDEWDSAEAISRRNFNRRPPDTYRTSGEYGEDFPLKNPPGSGGVGYIPYVDYSRDYNPPPTSNYNNRNSFYSGAQPLNNIDPRYSAAYGNPYLRVPSGAKIVQNSVYGSTGRLLPSVAGATAGTSHNVVNQTNLSASQNNNLNFNLNNKNVYNQLSQSRNNLRNNTINNQYVVLPQSERSSSGQGTPL